MISNKQYILKEVIEGDKTYWDIGNCTVSVSPRGIRVDGSANYTDRREIEMFDKALWNANEIWSRFLWDRQKQLNIINQNVGNTQEEFDVKVQLG